MENEEIRNPEVSAAAEPVANQNLNTAAEDAVAVEEDAVAVEAPAPERKPRPQIEVTDEMIEKSSKTLSTMLDFLGLAKSTSSSPAKTPDASSDARDSRSKASSSCSTA